MRRRRNEKRNAILFGGIVLAAAVIVAGMVIVARRSSSPAGQGAAVAAASSTAPAAPVKIGGMSVEGTAVTAQGKTYALSPVSGLTSPGSFAIEGKIVKVVPDPGTRSQTPYYLLLQDNGSPVIVGIVVPAGDGSDFAIRTFPVGSNVLVAGVVFPAANPSVAVFDYSELLKGLHVAPGIPQLNVPLDTPYLGANFRNIGTMS